jgi:hypothetical protein
MAWSLAILTSTSVLRGDGTTRAVLSYIISFFNIFSYIVFFSFNFSFSLSLITYNSE